MSRKRGASTVSVQGQENKDLDSLLGGLKKHKNFKQLATYNLSCLEKLLTPPANGWEANVNAIMREGSFTGIVEAMEAHTGDPAMLRSTATLIVQLCNTPEYTATIAKSGALKIALESFNACEDDEGVGSCYSGLLYFLHLSCSS